MHAVSVLQTEGRIQWVGENFRLTKHPGQGVCMFCSKRVGRCWRNCTGWVRRIADISPSVHSH